MIRRFCWQLALILTLVSPAFAQWGWGNNVQVSAPIPGGGFVSVGIPTGNCNSGYYNQGYYYNQVPVYNQGYYNQGYYNYNPYANYNVYRQPCAPQQYYYRSHPGRGWGRYRGCR